MKTEQEIQKAISIKDLETENYRTCPIVLLNDINNKKVTSLVYYIVLEEDRAENIKFQKHFTATEQESLLQTKEIIDNSITEGRVYEDPEGYTDYITLDEEFLTDLKKQMLYILGKNNTTQQPTGTNSSIISLVTAQDRQAAMVKARSTGGLNIYQLPNSQRVTGYLAYTIFDTSKRKYRVVTNDGSHGVAYSTFPGDMRDPNIIYIIGASDLGWSQKGNYIISAPAAARATKLMV